MTDDMFCDCKDSSIRWVDDARPHPVVTGPGWFCMGCLTEFTPAFVSGTEASVCQDIAARQQRGLAKYGVSVADNPLALKAWLQHAYEETLDNAVYLKRAMKEMCEPSRAALEILHSCGLHPDFYDTLEKAAEGVKDTISNLRDDIADPPSDVQSAVLRKLGVEGHTEGEPATCRIVSVENI